MFNRSTAVGTFPLLNPVICGSGEPVMTKAGIRAALRAGVAGVIAKSVNEQSAAVPDLCFQDLVGRVADALPGYGDQRETPGRRRNFVLPETLS